MSNQDSETLQSFVSKFPITEYPLPHTIVNPSNNPGHVYYVVSGRVIQYDIAANESKITLNVFGPHSVVSLHWVLTDKPNEYYYETQGPTSLVAIPVEKFNAFLQNNPILALEFLKRVISGSNGLMKRLSLHMQGDATKRILIELIIEAKRFSGPESNSAEITITIKELASRCGMARETVSRQFAVLSKMNLIEKTVPYIFIPSISSLEQQLLN